MILLEYLRSNNPLLIPGGKIPMLQQPKDRMSTDKQKLKENNLMCIK